MAPKQKTQAKTFETMRAYLGSHSFDVREQPGVANQIEARKYGCGAVLARADAGGIRYIAGPGCIVGGEISTLVDRGYQKFLITSRVEVAATADHLRSLHDFQQELAVATGHPDFYNLALGTVSDLYLYDRLKGRDSSAKSTTESH